MRSRARPSRGGWRWCRRKRSWHSSTRCSRWRRWAAIRTLARSRSKDPRISRSRAMRCGATGTAPPRVAAVQHALRRRKTARRHRGRACAESRHPAARRADRLARSRVSARDPLDPPQAEPRAQPYDCRIDTRPEFCGQSLPRAGAAASRTRSRGRCDGGDARSDADSAGCTASRSTSPQTREPASSQSFPLREPPSRRAP